MSQFDFFVWDNLNKQKVHLKLVLEESTFLQDQLLESSVEHCTLILKVVLQQNHNPVQHTQMEHIVKEWETSFLALKKQVSVKWCPFLIFQLK